MKKSELILHPFPPIFDENSKVLILGSFPSIKSREANIYFGNPKNRFWYILSKILNSPFPKTNQDKIELIEKNHIALWDVISSCEIQGSSDSSIKNPNVNDFDLITKVATSEPSSLLVKSLLNYSINLLVKLQYTYRAPVPLIVQSMKKN